MGHQCSKPILAIQNDCVGTSCNKLPPRLRREGADKMRTKILFLDVDGVLHPVHCKEEFIQPCVFQLCRIIQATGADIVLSTAWRLVPMAKKFLEAQMTTWGLHAPIDVTPQFSEVSAEGLLFKLCGVRGTVRPGEIKSWLETNEDLVDFPHWVAIDDIDMTAELDPHMVKTNKRVGLSQEDADRAIRILNSPHHCDCELCSLFNVERSARSESSCETEAFKAA